MRKLLQFLFYISSLVGGAYFGWQSQNFPGGGSSSSSSGAPLGSVSLSSFGAQGTTASHFINDATFTISSGSVSSQTSDIPWSASDIGKIMFGTNCSNQGGPTCISATLVMAQGTITGFTDAHHITVSNNSSANCSAACTFIWGPDDTTAFASWYAAQAPNCSGPLYIPSGVFLIQNQPTSLSSTMQCINNAQNSRQGVTVIGNGFSNSYIVPTPNFPINKGIFPDALSYAANFTIYGGDNNATSSSTGAAISFTTTSMANNVYCIGWGGNSGGFTGIAFGGTASFYSQMESDRCGSTGATANADYTFISNSYIGDNSTTGLSLGGSGTVFSSNNAFSGVGGGSPVILVNSGEFHSTGDKITNANAGGGNSVLRCAGICNLTNVRILQSGTGNPSNGLRVLSGGVANWKGGICTAPGTNASCVTVDSGGKATVSNMTTLTGTVAGVNNAGTYFDGGNNGAYTYTGAGVLIADGHSVKGACTGVATASSTLGLFGTGPNETVTTCTSTTIGSGITISGARTLQSLVVTASAGGVNASSGVVTVLKNGSTTTITCTIGTGTSCQDGTHQVAAADGDLISIQFSTQTAETLAGVKAIVQWQ